MKKFKKFLFAALSAAAIFSCANVTTVFAENYVILSDDNVSAKVIQIIDGDAIKVRLLDTNETALIKIIGVNSMGYDASVKYLTDKILGAVVTLAKDSNINIVSGSWNYRYVIFNGVNISNELVAKGYAALDTSQSNGSLYSYLTDRERAARSSQTELWGAGVNSSNTIAGNGFSVNRGSSGLAADKININTASVYQLKSSLDGVGDNLAQNIVKYRGTNPFNDKYEIMFVPGFTSDIFQSNKEKINVCTNLKTASAEELETLGISDEEVDDIIAYRNKSVIEELADFKRKNLIGDKKYENLKPYINVNDNNSIDETIGNYVVNFNTASEDQLKSAGLSAADAQAVVNLRVNGYTMKNIMELSFADSLNLSEQQLYSYEDNLHAVTNINQAKDSELRSVFTLAEISKIKNSGMFNSLSDIGERLSGEARERVNGCVYFSRNITEYININTATPDQIELTGLSAEKARTLAAAAPMKSAEDIPFNVADYNDKITLYTNINKASQAELKTLNNGLTNALITDIINYRNEQPFGSYDELKKFFIVRNASVVYDSIKDYVVLR